MHYVQSSLWSKRLEAEGLAQCAEVVCYDLLWTDVKKYKVVFILGLRVGVLHVTILVRGL